MSYPVRGVRRGKGRHRGWSRRTAALFAVLALATAVVGWLIASSRSSSWSSVGPNSSWTEGNTSDRLTLLASPVPSPPGSQGRRLVYPFSVVPGGVRTPQELQEASKHDPAVASHYVGFDYQRARVVELNQPKMVYLSYRIGDKIYWTRKKIGLHKGEKLITDGKLTARTRCANRVSEKVESLVSPQEPPAEKFEEPIADGGSSMQIPYPEEFASALQSRHPQFSGFGSGPLGPTGLGSSGLFGPYGSGGFPPTYPPPIPSSGCDPKSEHCKPPGPHGPPLPHPPPPPPPPPPEIPEPGTIFLVSSGIAGIYLRYRSRASKN